MQKYLSIIAGVIVGTLGAVVLIVSQPTVHGDSSVPAWNAIAAGDIPAWNDLFDRVDVENGTDLYYMMYGNLNVKPKNDAIKQIAFKYGLTTGEAEAAIGGSIAIFLNRPTTGTNRVQQEEAFQLVRDISDDYENLLELFEIEQELKARVLPSELFANGELSDSGFDLIHDLTIIEEILFLEDTPQSIGKPFESALDSPYNPKVEDKYYRGRFVTSETPLAVIPSISQGLTIDDDGEAAIAVGDEIVEVELLDQDICSPDDLFANALSDFEEAESAAIPDEDGRVRRAAADEPSGPGPSTLGPNTVGPEGTVSAPSGDWSWEWCPSAEADGPGVGVSVGVCLETELVLDKVSPYQPKDSCISCEVTQINAALDDLLSHSLLPNKVTGNLFESAKCKNSDALIDIQFITIWNPVPVPPSNDIIELKPIAEKWAEFMESFQPILPFETENNKQYTPDFQAAFQTKIAPPGTSQESILSTINTVREVNTARAEATIRGFDLGNEGSNVILYGKKVLTEFKQMNAFFKNYISTFKSIDTDALRDIKRKGYVQ